MKYEYEYIVYKTTNLVNNKIYVGVHRTRVDITDTYLGCGTFRGYIPDKKGFPYAVKKYGQENFIRETLFTFPDGEDGKIAAYKKEAEIVNREFIKDPNTYNICLGGRVPSSVHERAVVQYDLNGKFIRVWNSMAEAKSEAPTQSISDCCIRKTSSKQWQWRYFEGNTDDIEPAKIRTRVVYQFDLQGNYITYYKSVHDACRATGIPYQSIGGNCLNKQMHAGGFYWSYEKRFNFDPSKVRKTAVACYTDEGIFIKSFSTVKDACIEYNINHSSLLRCIQGKTKHSGKVRWRYFYGNTTNISPL